MIDDGRPVKYCGHVIVALFDGIDFVAKVDGESKGTYTDVASVMAAARAHVDRLYDNTQGERR